jgi:hypothetical protein
VYTWIWRRLPGGLPGKFAGSLVLMVGAVALLWFLVFPHADRWLPFQDITVDRAPTPTPSASATASP